jgi:hypothetical protein
MLRRLFTLVSALSPLLCVTAVVIWVRNLGGPPWDEVYTVRATHSYGIGMEHGGMIAFLQRERPEYHDADPDDVQMHAGGFRYLRITSAGMRRWNLALPAWLLVATTAALPLARGVLHVATARRRRPGLCRAGRSHRAAPCSVPPSGFRPIPSLTRPHRRW